MEKICPKCGASSLKSEFVADFCKNCALDMKTANMPLEVEVVICPLCSRVRIGGVWIEKADAAIREKVETEFRKMGAVGKYKNNKFVGHFRIGGQKGKFERDVEIKYLKNPCILCNRSTSGYFEAILQLRGDEEKVQKCLARLKKELMRFENFIPKEEEMHGGVDLYLGYKKDIEYVLHRLKLKFERTKKLSGQRRDGKRIYRDTFLIRL